MKIEEFKYAPFSLNLHKPLVSSRHTTISRSGYVIKITDDLNNTGYGEASPLTPFSVENLNNVQKELKELAGKLTGLKFKADYFLNPDSYIPEVYSPSVKFGVETALLNLILSSDKLNLQNVLGYIPKSKISINAMIGLLETKKILDLTHEYVKLGFKTIKYKIGRDKFIDDLNLIDTVFSKFGNSINIRLDVNGKWSLHDAEEHLIRLKNYNIEFIEQPVDSLEELQKLSHKTQLPLAADESLKTYNDFVKLNEGSRINFFVIKPSLFGGIKKTLRIIKAASENGKFVIISSLFESNIGNDSLIRLASVLNHEFAHGLSTQDYFEANIKKSTYKTDMGKIFLEKSFPSSSKNLDSFFKS